MEQVRLTLEGSPLPLDPPVPKVPTFPPPPKVRVSLQEVDVRKLQREIDARSHCRDCGTEYSSGFYHEGNPVRWRCDYCTAKKYGIRLGGKNRHRLAAEVIDEWLKKHGLFEKATARGEE